MNKKLEKLVDEICKIVKNNTDSRRYVDDFLRGIDFNRVDVGIHEDDLKYASNGLEDVFYYYENYYDDYSDIFTNEVVDLLLKLQKELSKLTESKKSIKESKDDLIQVTEENPVFPYWVYDTHRKVLNDIFDMCFYKKKFDIFVTNIGNGDKVEIYIVNDDMHVILAKDFANFVIHNINNANEYLTNLPYVSFYKTNVEIDGYVDKRYYGQFLKNFLDTVYKY